VFDAPTKNVFIKKYYVFVIFALCLLPQSRINLAKKAEELSEELQGLDLRLHDEEQRIVHLEAERKKLQTTVQDLEDQ